MCSSDLTLALESEENFAFLNLRNYSPAPGGQAATLAFTGGNPALQAEKADIWTIGADLAPAVITGLKLSATYFDYDFHDKIATPGDNAATELTDPATAYTVTLNPTPAQIASVLAQSAEFINGAGPQYTAYDAIALVDLRYRNLAAWTASGIDLAANYSFETKLGNIAISDNATWLTQKQQGTPASIRETISGVLYGPPKLKDRFDAVLTHGSWSFSTHVNYVAGEQDPAQTPPQQIKAFTTVDAQLGYDAKLGPIKTHFAISALNIFDVNPPTVAATSTPIPGVRYDSTNASPLGRLVNLSARVTW